ncbi:MAG: hypothetical protein C5B50_06060 [Verrucomicrobia bacterium]|nr:MAG: hypothetical protein C5B50_06060 [Verrucomicrobiota bacterium]
MMAFGTFAKAAPIQGGLTQPTVPGPGAIQPVPTPPAIGMPAAIDPATGLPMAKPEWKGPEKALTEVSFDNIPIIEVGKNLKDMFGNEFDVLLPYGATPMAPVNWRWEDTLVTLRLKNVKASEVFNAMNMVFETAKTPLQWDLIMNGHRPTALLRIVNDLVPGLPGSIDPTTGLPVAPNRPHSENSMVFFVGELVGDPKNGGMSLDDILQTMREVYKAGTGGDPQHITCHEKAQLLIVHAVPEDIGFVQSALAALREKARLDARRQLAKEHGAEFKAETGEPKAGTSSGQAGAEHKTRETKPQ